MANCYTKAALKVPCTKEQGVIFLQAIEEMEENTQLAQECFFGTRPIEKGNKLEELLHEIDHPDIDHDSMTPEDVPFIIDQQWSLGFEAQLIVEADETYLKINHGETITEDLVVIWVTAFLTVFDLPHLINTNFAYICDRARVGEFGGFGISMSKDHVRYYGTNTEFLAEEEAHEKGEKYYLVKPINGKDYVLRAKKDVVMESLSGESYTDLEPVEFQTLGKYLTKVDYAAL